MIPPQLNPLRLLTLVCLLAGLATPARAGIELFGKGSVSQNFLDKDKNTISITVSGGLAISLFSSVRLEARYTNITSLQNKLEIMGDAVVGTLNNINTETAIYSLGLDIEFLGEKSAFQPFIYIGAGYIQTARSYYFTDANTLVVTYLAEPKQMGVSANGGIGFRLRIARALALEVEAFAYAMDLQTKNPLINLYGTAGIRIYL